MTIIEGNDALDFPKTQSLARPTLKVGKRVIARAAAGTSSKCMANKWKEEFSLEVQKFAQKKRIGQNPSGSHKTLRQILYEMWKDGEECIKQISQKYQIAQTTLRKYFDELLRERGIVLPKCILSTEVQAADRHLQMKKLGDGSQKGQSEVKISKEKSGNSESLPIKELCIRKKSRSKYEEWEDIISWSRNSANTVNGRISRHTRVNSELATLLRSCELVIEEKNGITAGSKTQSSVKPPLKMRKIVVPRADPIWRKKHLCRYCGSTYSSKISLKIHKESKHECYNLHLSTSAKKRVYEDEEDKILFECLLCPTGFRKKWSLRRHLQKKHGSDESYFCFRCDKTYDTLSSCSHK